MNKLNRALVGIFLTVFLCLLTSVTAIVGARICVEQNKLLSTAMDTPPQPFGYSNYDYSYGHVEDLSPRSSSDRHSDRHAELLKQINSILGEQRYPDAYYSIEPQGKRDMSDDGIYRYQPQYQPRSNTQDQDDVMPEAPQLRIPFYAFPPLMTETNDEDQDQGHDQGAEKQPEYGLFFVH